MACGESQSPKTRSGVRASVMMFDWEESRLFVMMVYAYCSAESNLQSMYKM